MPGFYNQSQPGWVPPKPNITPSGSTAVGPDGNVGPFGGRPIPQPGADPAPAPGMGKGYLGTYVPPDNSGEGVLSGPGYDEEWYKKHGEDLVNTPSASEDLYSRGVSGSNPFYDYAQQQTIKAINDASAARGNSNSSFTMKNIGNAVADLRGQQAHELGQLAGQADSAKTSRYGASQRFANSAQDSTESRINQVTRNTTDLADKQARLVNPFYSEAGRQMSAADMANIELLLKKAGLSGQQAKEMLDMWGAGVKTLFGGMG